MLGAVKGVLSGSGTSEMPETEPVMPGSDRASKPTAIVAMASNSSLCGGFNSNIIAKVRSERHPGDVIYSVGRKMADAMRRDGFPSPEDLNELVEHPAYSPAAALVEKLAHEVEEGHYDRVVLVYTHFVSTARQVPVVEQLLPAVASIPNSDRAFDEDILIEPGKKELLESLLPKTLKLKLYAALLDSVAAEHAARTVAMQTATDNAENLLSELTLQYNKGRQQKITAEILDLAGGQTE
jgi:F-type H+-transporting ATPase subunit gamma